MRLWKENILDYGWELCKRPTGCKGCHKTMLKGERRLKTIQPGYRFKIVNYYCSDCGDVVQRTPDHSLVVFNLPLGEVLLEKSSKVIRKRMLRPE